MDSQQEYVLRAVEERDIRIVRLWFSDILGTLKSVAIAPAELESAFAEGIGFDGSAIEGFSRISESDTIAMPDPSTFQLLPLGVGDGGIKSARMFCDILNPDGQALYSDPRQLLRPGQPQPRPLLPPRRHARPGRHGHSRGILPP